MLLEKTTYKPYTRPSPLRWEGRGLKCKASFPMRTKTVRGQLIPKERPKSKPRRVRKGSKRKKRLLGPPQNCSFAKIPTLTPQENGRTTKVQEMVKTVIKGLKNLSWGETRKPEVVFCRERHKQGMC